MNNQFTDSDFDNLISGNDVGLAATNLEPVAEAPQPVPPGLNFFGKIPVNVTLEVASTEIPLKELMDVDVSSVIMLDKLAGEPLDVKVNGALFARAEVVVMNGNYGLRVLELTGTSLDGLTQ